MKEGAQGTELPSSIGGLIGFGLRSWAANAALYLALAAGVFAAYALAESVLPAVPMGTPQGQFKEFVLQYTGLFTDAFVTAAAALGVAARASGTVATPRMLTGAAVERWLPVIAVSFIAQAVMVFTAEFSGLQPVPGPHALLYLTAPLTWMLWGIVSLAGPFVALDPNRGGIAVVSGLGRAFTLSLRRPNLLRLAVISALSVVPIFAQVALQNALFLQHTPRAFFWADAPIDALTVAPLAALQAAFALDFLRRAGQLEQPPP